MPSITSELLATDAQRVMRLICVDAMRTAFAIRSNKPRGEGRRPFRDARAMAEFVTNA